MRGGHKHFESEERRHPSSIPTDGQMDDRENLPWLGDRPAETGVEVVPAKAKG
jgi:hypothetical protein